MHAVRPERHASDTRLEAGTRTRHRVQVLEHYALGKFGGYLSHQTVVRKHTSRIVLRERSSVRLLSLIEAGCRHEDHPSPRRRAHNYRILELLLHRGCERRVQDIGDLAVKWAVGHFPTPGE